MALIIAIHLLVLGTRAASARRTRTAGGRGWGLSSVGAAGSTRAKAAAAR